MNRIFYTMLTVVLGLAIGLLPALALAAGYNSGDKVTTPGENTLAWTGQGADETPGEYALSTVGLHLRWWHPTVYRGDALSGSWRQRVRHILPDPGCGK
jgi:hypothetical protein